jgi:hypothetical protein
VAGRAIRDGVVWNCASQDELLGPRISYDDSIIMAAKKSSVNQARICVDGRSDYRMVAGRAQWVSVGMSRDSQYNLSTIP